MVIQSEEHTCMMAFGSIRKLGIEETGCDFSLTTASAPCPDLMRSSFRSLLVHVYGCDRDDIAHLCIAAPCLATVFHFVRLLHSFLQSNAHSFHADLIQAPNHGKSDNIQIDAQVKDPTRSPSERDGIHFVLANTLLQPLEAEQNQVCRARRASVAVAEPSPILHATKKRSRGPRISSEAQAHVLFSPPPPPERSISASDTPGKDQACPTSPPLYWSNIVCIGSPPRVR